MAVVAAVREWQRSVKAAAVVCVAVEAVVVVVRGGVGQGQGSSSSAWRGQPHQGGRQRGVVGRDPLNHPLIPLTRGLSAPSAPILSLVRGGGVKGAS